MRPADRERFDEQLERVLAELPGQIHELLEEVPLIVDDRPSAQVMADRGVSSDEVLCGLYTGIPLTDRSIGHSGVLPDQITIYREGIQYAALDEQGRLSLNELRRQIRITILHEVGHHFGLDEEDLEELGYG